MNMINKSLVWMLVFLLSAYVVSGEEQNRQVEELATAAAGGNLQRVRELISAGADVNGFDSNQGVTPLIKAILFGHITVVKALLEAGADVNRPDQLNGATPLMFAVRKGETKKGITTAPIEKKYEIAEMLVGAGANVMVTRH